MPFKKGNKLGGRKKGVPNKTTAAVKEILQDAFHQLGGVEALVRWGRSNRTQFYKLWAKLLPQEIAHGGGLTVEIQTVEGVSEPDILGVRSNGVLPNGNGHA